MKVFYTFNLNIKISVTANECVRLYKDYSFMDERILFFPIQWFSSCKRTRVWGLSRYSGEGNISKIVEN